MKNYIVSYVYGTPDGKNRSSTSIQIKGESVSDVKDRIKTKHQGRGQKVLEWRNIRES